MSDTALRLIVFDCDGTLVDSQPLIARTMAAAFDAHDLTPPSATETSAIVGMDLAAGIDILLPATSNDDPHDIATTYRAIFKRIFGKPGGVPRPYEGMMDVLKRVDGGANLLGVCTGRSHRSLDPILALNGMEDRFVTLQTGARHPGKPHPAMLETALAEAGVTAARALMIGDATFDMEMSRNADVHAVGVTWGSHGAEALQATDAARTVDTVDALEQAIFRWLADTP